MYRTPLLAVAASALALLASAASAAGNEDGVWVDSVIHNLVVTGPATASARPVPLFVIAPVSSAHPLHPLADASTHGFGAHDHVIALPPTAKSFRGVCDLTLVVPGPKAVIGSTVEARPTLTPAGKKPLLDAARLNGRLLALTSAARIEEAHQQGRATLIDTHTDLACTVTPAAR